MLSADLAPHLFVFMAVCGGGSESSERVSSAGWTCDEIQMMVDAELSFGTQCSRNFECDQIIPDTGECPTDDLVLNIDYEAEYLFSFMDQADEIGCAIDFGTRGSCPEEADPACVRGVCGWR